MVTDEVLRVNKSDCTTNHSEDRGLIFKDRAGLGLTFVHDTPPPQGAVPVWDLINASDNEDASQPVTTMAGWLYFRNGSRARVFNSRIVESYDRHGNQISYCYTPCVGGVGGGGWSVGEITDALNRKYTIEYQVADGAYGTVDRIKYRPNNTTAEQIIRVEYGLSNATGTLTDTPTGALFPGLNFPGTSAARMVPIRVYLPNAAAGAPSYRLRYNKFAELAEVTLPTGGKVDYVYGAGVDCRGLPGCYDTGQVLDSPFGAGFLWSTASPPAPERPAWAPMIYRRLLMRREYADGSAVVSRTTSIGRFESVMTTAQQTHDGVACTNCITRYASATIKARHYVEVQDSGLSVPAPIVTRHYFHGNTMAQAGRFIPDSVNAPPPAYDTNPDVWDISIGPAIELFTKEHALTRVMGYPDTFLAKEYRMEVVGHRRVDRAYGLSGHSAELCQENTTLLDGTVMTSGTFSQYDTLQNRVELYEYGFGAAPAFTTEAMTGFPFFARNCPASAPGGFTRRTRTAYRSDYVALPAHLLSLVSSTESFSATDGSSSPSARTDYSYDATAPAAISGLARWTNPGHSMRGNVTTVTRTLKDLYSDGSNNAATTLSESRNFDIAGNVVSATDARNNTAAYAYADQCDGSMPAGPLHGFLSQVSLSVNGTTQFRAFRSDCYLGKPVQFTDRDQTVIRMTYETAANQLNRLREVTHPSLAKTDIAYVDTPLAFSNTESSDQLSIGDRARVRRVDYDGLGRAARTTQGTGAAAITTRVDLDGLGRVLRQYLPYAAPDTGTKYTEQEYDKLGRVTKIRHMPDGAQVLFQYASNLTTRTDEAGKVVRMVSDAFGRLTEVTEAPAAENYRTLYTYNVLDSLTLVQQLGSTGSPIVTRQFDYDSLGRLRKAVNPERGTTRYQYDGTGNLVSRSEGDGTLVTHTYL